MLIFGFHRKTLGKYAYPSPCPNCHNPEQRLHVIGRYLHFSLIPAIPGSKRIAISCNACGLTRAHKELQRDLVEWERVHPFIQRVKTPLWYWVGSLVLALFALTQLFAFAKHDRQLEAFLQEPVAASYVVREADGTYLVGQVAQVFPSHVVVLQSDTKYASRSEAAYNSGVGKECILTREEFGKLDICFFTPL